MFVPFNPLVKTKAKTNAITLIKTIDTIANATVNHNESVNGNGSVKSGSKPNTLK